MKQPQLKFMYIFITSATLLQLHLVRSWDQQDTKLFGSKTIRVTELKCREYNRETNFAPYAYGGKSAVFREYPHMAAIGWLKFKDSYVFDCGGALISPKFVLTAAHCTYSHGANNPIPQVVLLGVLYINSSVDDSSVQVAIKNIHKHPEYTRKKHYNDIALLELATAVNFSQDVKPICIWTRELTGLKEAIATGWGVTNPATNEKAKVLQKVVLSILGTEVCTDLLKNNMNRKWDQGIISSQICAGEPRGVKDTCQGDSGSPLQVTPEEYFFNYFVIGITSFGPRVCAQLPAIYTKVNSYLDWIENIVWPEEYQNWITINRKK